MKFKALYAACFARKGLAAIHRKFLSLGLNGLGIGNHDNVLISGEAHCLKWLAKKGIRNVFDIGANEGNYTAEVLKHCPQARVVCFEPHPRTAERLRRRFTENPRVRVLATALGDRSGTARLSDYQSRPAGSRHASLAAGVIDRIHGATPTSIEVPIDRLDDIMKRERIAPPDFIKIDVEGLELAVVAGARETLREPYAKYLQFEFGVMQLQTGTTLAMMRDALADFELYRMLPHDFIEIGDTFRLENRIFHYQNILAIRR